MHICTMDRIKQLSHRLDKARSTARYWEEAGYLDRVNCWQRHILELQDELGYHATHLETFAMLKPGRVQDALMPIVAEIRAKVSGGV